MQPCAAIWPASDLRDESVGGRRLLLFLINQGSDNLGKENHPKAFPEGYRSADLQ